MGLTVVVDSFLQLYGTLLDEYNIIFISILLMMDILVVSGLGQS